MKMIKLRLSTTSKIRHYLWQKLNFLNTINVHAVLLVLQVFFSYSVTMNDLGGFEIPNFFYGVANLG